MTRLCAGIVGLGVSLTAGWAAPSPQRVSLQLKWQHQFQFAGYYAAEAQGYYRAAGLEVELREAAPGKDPVEEVLAGRADFGVGTSELVLLRAKGRSVVVLAAIFQHSPLVLLARRDAGVNDLHDLHDKPLMIEPQSAELFAYFKYEGVDPQRLPVRPHTFGIEDLITGRVAAMSAYATDEPFLLRQAGVPFLEFMPRSGGIDFYGDNLFTTEAQLTAQPERVRAFLKASLQGWDYALAHPDEIIALIRARYSQRKSVEHLQFEAQQTAQLMHPGLIEVGHMNPGRWQHIADTYAEFGMLPRGFSLHGFLFDLGSAPERRWLHWLLAGATILAVAGFGWALPLLRLNRRLRRSEREFRELTDNAPFPVAITDIETSRVLFVNRRIEELIGQPASELLGEPALNFYHNPADREKLVGGLRATGVVHGLEVRLSRRDGRALWTLVSAGAVEFGGRAALVVAFQDITERRAIEQELRRAKEEAETADAAKGRYLAVLSHEVRTPLNGMLGMVSLLQSEPLSREGREHLEILDRSGHALAKLVNDLLDFARADSGKVELESVPIDVAEFVRELCALFRPAAEAKGVALRFDLRPDVPARVVTDPMRLRQILSNLLANGIKFTQKGAVEIRVERIGGARREGRCRLRFHVDDTGIGIPAEQIAQLFEPYVQADASVARRFGGSGLGLSISKRLAQLLGGGITVQSSTGAGSTFTLEIEAEVQGPVG